MLNLKAIELWLKSKSGHVIGERPASGWSLALVSLCPHSRLKSRPPRTSAARSATGTSWPPSSWISTRKRWENGGHYLKLRRRLRSSSSLQGDFFPSLLRTSITVCSVLSERDSLFRRSCYAARSHDDELLFSSTPPCRTRPTTGCFSALSLSRIIFLQE